MLEGQRFVVAIDRHIVPCDRKVIDGPAIVLANLRVQATPAEGSAGAREARVGQRGEPALRAFVTERDRTGTDWVLRARQTVAFDSWSKRVKR